MNDTRARNARKRPIQPVWVCDAQRGKAVAVAEEGRKRYDRPGVDDKEVFDLTQIPCLVERGYLVRVQ